MPRHALVVATEMWDTCWLFATYQMPRHGGRTASQTWCLSLIRQMGERRWKYWHISAVSVPWVTFIASGNVLYQGWPASTHKRSTWYVKTRLRTTAVYTRIAISGEWGVNLLESCYLQTVRHAKTLRFRGKFLHTRKPLDLHLYHCVVPTSAVTKCTSGNY